MENNSRQRMNKEELSSAKAQIYNIVENVERVLVGKRESVELVVLSLLSGGHVLIEDVPGVGKTSLVSALAKSISCDFKRIQFTPDIMPSDLTGFSIYNQKTGEFEFRPGAVMSNLVLADEINRASAKTQASLLEAMEEKQVTVDTHTYQLSEPFMVLATQNPVDSFGTYPLPEAQIDRFMLKLSIGYPEFDDELLVTAHKHSYADEVHPVVSSDDILALRRQAGRVFVDEALLRYIVSIVSATRKHPSVLLGSSPRGGIALHDLCRAFALSGGRDYVIPDDVKYLAPFALGHRLILTHEAKSAKLNGQKIISEILENIIVPKD